MFCEVVFGTAHLYNSMFFPCSVENIQLHTAFLFSMASLYLLLYKENNEEVD